MNTCTLVAAATASTGGGGIIRWGGRNGTDPKRIFVSKWRKKAIVVGGLSGSKFLAHFRKMFGFCRSVYMQNTLYTVKTVFSGFWYVLNKLVDVSDKAMQFRKRRNVEYAVSSTIPKNTKY